MLENPYIKSEWFAQSSGEKTKFNWFCFELALEFYTYIMKNVQLGQFRKRCGEEEIGRLCTYFALEMKKSVVDSLSGKEDSVIIDEAYIADFLPQYSPKTHQKLLGVACAAWESQTKICEICPSRCISEKDEYCEFFDSDFYK